MAEMKLLNQLCLKSLFKFCPSIRNDHGRQASLSRKIVRVGATGWVYLDGHALELLQRKSL